MMKWQDLERLVRRIAEAKFGGTARAENIAGVKCDCVIYLEDGSVVLIEISKNDKIDKLRTDIAKFNVLRPHFIAKNMFPICYFVTMNDPSGYLIDAGKSNFVKVYSAWQLFDTFLGLGRYLDARVKVPFGSAVNLYSGEPDRNKYVSVKYVNVDGEGYTVEQISDELIRGKTIVLIGDYGSGKSRCVQEVFENLVSRQKDKYSNPIAINLRDNWGMKRAEEILTRHYTDLGLTNFLDEAIKIAYSPLTIYLLDGFDEIGAQTWSNDPTKLVEIRKQSLIGVKDLVNKSRGGIFIAGREHYFNNDAELIECLGVDRKSPMFIYCNPQLTNDQFSEFLGRAPSELPSWIPKKPLIAAIIRDIDVGALDEFLSTSSGEVDFWNLLIDTFCEREAKINPILDPEIIRGLYAKIGRLTRSTETPFGPISIKQINEIFERVTGRPPTDESAIVLQRLPGLSRIGAESLDRQFADNFILDGLKAEDVLEILSQGTQEPLDEKWKYPIEEFGALFVSTKLQSTRQSGAAFAYIKRNKNIGNRIILSDLLAALFLCGEDSLDFSGQTLTGGRFFKISLAETCVHNLNIHDAHFEYLDITDAEPKGIILSNSTIVRLAGMASSEHAPVWFKDCLVEVYQTVETLSAIREAGLSLAQTFLLSSLRKLFLQPGGGRKESSMYKGYGDSASKRICDKVIQLLVR